MALGVSFNTPPLPISQYLFLEGNIGSGSEGLEYPGGNNHLNSGATLPGRGNASNVNVPANTDKGGHSFQCSVVGATRKPQWLVLVSIGGGRAHWESHSGTCTS